MELSLKLDLLTELLSDFSDILDDEKKLKLIRFYDMLIEKNKVMNLTAITDLRDVITKHFADSLSISAFFDLNGRSVIDIGTGAGFPGIPLKICFPDAEITLLDSLNKRLLFLDEVIRELDLKKITTVHARAEEAAHQVGYRERYDLAVSRAVANLSTLVEYSLPFVSLGGTFVSYKGPKAAEELEVAGRAITILGGGDVLTHPVRLSCLDDERNLVAVSKLKHSPYVYPRSGGKPSKDPII